MGNCPCFAGASKSIGGGRSGNPNYDSSSRREAVQFLQPGSSQKLTILAKNEGKHPQAFYEIEQNPFSSGAFGTVRRAKSRMTGQPVAIKQLDKKGIDIAVQQNEIDINMEMDHPNIVRMYDTFMDSRYLWIVLEVCDGGEMFDLIINQGSLSEVESSVIMEQIFRAINYLHNHSVAHRDLKPENFLLAKKGKVKGKSGGVPLLENTLKVIDFGIAKKFNKGEVNPFKTKAGTPYYIAPEILMKNARYNEKCDIWSCGVMLYILLTGTPPFAGDTDNQILEAVRRGAVDFNIPEFRGVSNEAKDLIKVCCEKSVSKRLSAQEALATPFIKQKKDRSVAQDHSAGVNVVAKLKAFSGSNRFKKAAIHIIAHHIDDTQIKKLRDTFTQMDANGDGELSIDEIKAGCNRAGLADVEEIDKMFSQIDTDGSGSIGYSEFIAAMLEHQNFAKKEQCWEAFRVFDKDGNGKITQTEFHEIMKDYDQSGIKGLKSNELAEMFANADADGDGEIDFDEFVKMMNT